MATKGIDLGLIPSNGEVTKKVYDKEAFATLVECCTRLFCCDEEIVIMDLLLNSECAICERDIESEIGLAERKLREHLARLERQGLVTRTSVGPVADIYQKPIKALKRDLLQQQQQQQQQQPSVTSQSFWRVSNFIIIAIHYRLRKMEEVLLQRRKSLHESDKFTCPSCQSTFDALDVQKLEIDGIDAHFVCYCGTKVELDDKSAKDDAYSSQQQRCQEQIANLKKCLVAVWGMEVPVFPMHKKSTATGTDASTSEATNKTVADGSRVADDIVNDAASQVETSSVLSASSGNISFVGTQASVGSRTLKLSGANGDKSKSPHNMQGKIKFHLGSAANGVHGTGNVGGGTRHLAVDVKRPSSSTYCALGGNKDTTPTSDSQASTTAPVVASAVDIKTASHSRRGPMPSLSPSTTMPLFYISKLDTSLPLNEAQDHQQHMTHEEFEKFVELQDQYLNIL